MNEELTEFEKRLLRHPELVERIKREIDSGLRYSRPENPKLEEVDLDELP